MKNLKLPLKIQNLILVTATLALAFSILGVSVVKTSALSQSQNFKIAPATMGAIEEPATPLAKQKVEYFLAYPGILPDHLLYPIKMARDRIWLWLTTDSLKKAELLLLFADKRLGAGKALIEGNKIELGISTLTKAEKYLERAVSEERIAVRKGKDTQAFLEKLSLASLKHEEVLLEISQKAPENIKPIIETTLKYARRGYEQVRERIGK